MAWSFVDTYNRNSQGTDIIIIGEIHRIGGFITAFWGGEFSIYLHCVALIDMAGRPAFDHDLPITDWI